MVEPTRSQAGVYSLIRLQRILGRPNWGTTSMVHHGVLDSRYRHLTEILEHDSGRSPMDASDKALIRAIESRDELEAEPRQQSGPPASDRSITLLACFLP